VWVEQVTEFEYCATSFQTSFNEERTADREPPFASLQKDRASVPANLVVILQVTRDNYSGSNHLCGVEVGSGGRHKLPFTFDVFHPAVCTNKVKLCICNRPTQLFIKTILQY
jgi:hypothetical protein